MASLAIEFVKGNIEQMDSDSCRTDFLRKIILGYVVHLDIGSFINHCKFICASRIITALWLVINQEG